MRAFPGSASRIHGYLAHHRRLKYTSLDASLHPFSGTSRYFFGKKLSLLSPGQFFAPSQILLFSLLDAQHHGREPQVKYRTTLPVGPILSPDAPPVSFHEPPADSQAQANSAAASFVTALYLIKAVKDTLDEMWRDAWPVIGYMQGKPRSFFRLLMLIGG